MADNFDFLFPDTNGFKKKWIQKDGLRVPPTVVIDAERNKLPSVILNANGSYDFLKGKLLHTIVFVSDADATISIGLTSNGTEVSTGLTILQGIPYTCTLDYYMQNNTTFYFSGITGLTKLYFFIM